MALPTRACSSAGHVQLMKNNHRSVSTTAAHSKEANSRRIVVARAATQEQSQQQPQPQPATTSSRRHLTLGAAAAAAAALAAGSSTRSAARAADEQPPFVETPSGLLVQDIRVGTGDIPRKGGRVSVHWSGYTKGYQGKRIDNTSVRDEPYEFTLGSGEAIAAFDEAVAGMRVGGIRRIEVPGGRGELGYSRDRNERFTGELVSAEGKIFKYRRGPQPKDLGGQRALDFVLDNATLQDFNRTLLFDIKLLAARPPPSGR